MNDPVSNYQIGKLLHNEYQKVYSQPKSAVKEDMIKTSLVGASVITTLTTLTIILSGLF